MVEDHVVLGLPTQGSSGHSQQQDVNETTQEQVNTQSTQERAEIETSAMLQFTFLSL